MPPTTLPAKYIKTKQEGLRLVTPLQADVEALTVSSEEEYQAADVLLADIDRAMKAWAEKTDPILSPLQKAMKELKEAEKGAKALDAEIRLPLTGLYNTVRDKMRDYKLAERRRLQEAEEARQRQEAETARKLEETAAREQTARTKQMRDRLAKSRQHLETELEDIQTSTVEAVEGEASTARNVKKWRLVNKAAAMKAHPELFCLDTTVCAQLQRAGGVEAFANLAGFEVYEDVVIARR